MLIKIWDRFWKDDEGKVVIWQWPNIPLYAWAGLTFVSLLFSGKFSDILSVAGTIALIYWSLLEMFKGVNYFRRLLGLLILIFAVKTLINNLF